MTEDWHEVRRCNWLHEAEFLKSVLEGSGIDSRIPDQHTLAVQPLYANILGGVRLLVRERDRDRAIEILDATTPGSQSE
jgi:hypothetical protein